MDITFFEYSNSKRYSVTPDIVEYDEKMMPEPAFDLILGTNTMNELGIVLNLKEKTITIDEIILPMRNINNLSKSKIKSLVMHTKLAQEPKSTEEATQRILKILDAKYEKADLQAIVKNNCSHLNSNEQKLLLELGYYTIRLDPDASKICTIIFPWGKYSYKRLPMGVAGSPDICLYEHT